MFETRSSSKSRSPKPKRSAFKPEDRARRARRGKHRRGTRCPYPENEIRRDQRPARFATEESPASATCLTLDDLRTSNPEFYTTIKNSQVKKDMDAFQYVTATLDQHEGNWLVKIDRERSRRSGELHRHRHGCVASAVGREVHARSST